MAQNNIRNGLKARAYHYNLDLGRHYPCVWSVASAGARSLLLNDSVSKISHLLSTGSLQVGSSLN